MINNLFELIDFDSRSVEEIRQIVIDMREAIDKASKVLKKREEEAERQIMLCSNPDCRKPLASDRAAVSTWVVKDPRTGFDVKLRACSQRCHMIIHRFQNGERAIKT